MMLSELLDKCLEPTPRRCPEMLKEWYSVATRGDEARMRWCVTPANLTITFGNPENGAWTYQVDLEHCRNSAAILDWIAQVSGKPWKNPARVVYELIVALDDVLSLQGALCGGGFLGAVGNSLTREQIAHAVKLWQQRPCEVTR